MTHKHERIGSSSGPNELTRLFCTCGHEMYDYPEPPKAEKLRFVAPGIPAVILGIAVTLFTSPDGKQIIVAPYDEFVSDLRSTIQNKPPRE